MKRVAVSTLGCKTNQFESAAMIEQLKAAGYSVVPFGEESDFYIINSCTVTARTDSETRRHIRRARRLNPKARIIATGCYAQVAPGELEKMPELDCILGNMEKQNISALLESNTNSVSDISDIHSAAPLKLTSFAEHTRAFLQIQNGCNSFCAYCIVPFARGSSRSVQFNDVIKGIRDLVDNNFKEIVLTGIHLGAYGLDLKNPFSLQSLIKEIDKTDIVQRLRIGSIEPNEVTDELLHLMSSSKNICQHLHLPLQSGSDTVLQRMGRCYNADFFREKIEKTAAAMPNAFIGADVIAGFPGETESEFNETVTLLEELPLSDLHVFPYSSRPGTRAAGMPGHLPAHLISHRAANLRQIAKRKKETFLGKLAGQTLNVLVQSYDSNHKISKGLSRNYVSVSFQSDNPIINTEVPIFITGSNGDICGGSYKPTI
ncbi:MAG: tRNA (N(6)-L-threonylcarbamoyladenosine(37)-C(2))-methylthiotransferase MtaB [Desulfuromonadaceae bacterium]|nr:tRNA (N(6)-L-threonylcarbamoyladenosine(37)-C(2))-methylthiotransferase MtaB [Desulfuromonadaceae bacterium]